VIDNECDLEDGCGSQMIQPLEKELNGKDSLKVGLWMIAMTIKGGLWMKYECPKSQTKFSSQPLISYYISTYQINLTSTNPMNIPQHPYQAPFKQEHASNSYLLNQNLMSMSPPHSYDTFDKGNLVHPLFTHSPPSLLQQPLSFANPLLPNPSIPIVHHSLDPPSKISSLNSNPTLSTPIIHLPDPNLNPTISTLIINPLYHPSTNKVMKDVIQWLLGRNQTLSCNQMPILKPTKEPSSIMPIPLIPSSNPPSIKLIEEFSTINESQDPSCSHVVNDL